MKPTSTHLLCGGGGDAAGFREAGFEPVYGANHMQVCIDTMRANHPGMRLDCADVSQLAMTGIPASDVLVASVICTEVSAAGARSRSSEDYDKRFERTRATAYDVLRATEAHNYAITVTENVAEFAKWKLFDWWLEGFRQLDRKVMVVSVNAAHISEDDNPAPGAWRDRIIVVTARGDVQLPDLTPRPLAWCSNCRRDVRAYQRWTAEGLYGNAGKYGQQYRYACPNKPCGAVVEPYVRTAADVFDLTDVGEKIRDKDKVVKPSTLARLEKTLHYMQTDDTKRLRGPQQRPEGPRRQAVIEWRKNCAAAAMHEPLSTVSAGGRHHGIVSAPEGWRPGQRLSIHDLDYRAIEPHEQKRALRFAADYQFCGNKTQQTSLAGNAVAVNVAQWVGERVMAVLT